MELSGSVADELHVSERQLLRPRTSTRRAADEIRKRGETTVPVGKARPALSTCDIAAVGALALSQPGQSKAYDLTGRRSITTRSLGFRRVLGRPTTPQPIVAEFSVAAEC
ncbi:MAG: hypothetical protein IPM07_16410 [Anaerolineales bacterium]|nr:hypothetical protein [Anaerolineales bacterium]